MNKPHYIGLMSGTSLDAIDAVCVSFNDERCQLLAAANYPLPADVTQQITAQFNDTTATIDAAFELDRQLGYYFSQAVEQLVTDNNLDKSSIQAIGSHGQTIRHRPNQPHAFTLQIGDPNTIATETNIDVIADFRKKDIALGGEGAPLVPAFHHAMFAKGTATLVVNIGGIANVTALPTTDASDVLGFDTGPGNTLLDQWFCMHHENPPRAYDSGGRWGEKGTVNATLLEAMIDDEYFNEFGPKSTGREYFNLEWLDTFLQQEAFKQVSPIDVQATLTHLTAKSIAFSLRYLLQNAAYQQILLCGGGCHNQFLVSLLHEYLPEFSIQSTEVRNIHPDWVEACAFAWLAKQFTEQKSGNIPAVTGAKKEAILGAHYPAD